jgi:hypothetical protein
VSYLQLGDEGHEVEGYGDRLPEAGQVSGAAPVRDPLAPVGVPLLQSYKKKKHLHCVPFTMDESAHIVRLVQKPNS